jgi:hypothetical protein
VKGMKVIIKVDKIAEEIISYHQEEAEEIQMRNLEKSLCQLLQLEKRKKDIWTNWLTKKLS